MKSKGKINWEEAPDIKVKVDRMLKVLERDEIAHRVYCVRSYNSRARIYARIWGLPRLWQDILGEDAAYIIEILSEKFDHLREDKQEEILLHEIAHIPKNFSGSLLPHTRRRGKRNFEDRVHEMVSLFKKSK